MDFFHRHEETKDVILSKEEVLVKYFKAIGNTEKEQIGSWCKVQEAQTEKQEFYLNVLARTRKYGIADFCIATLEPSVKNGKIYYQKGEKVAKGFTLEEWDKMAKEFCPERNSRLATLEELFLFYAYRNAQDLWSISDVCDSSIGIGNFFDAPKAKNGFETSGHRETAGYFDGIGNTSKICRYDDLVFTVTGGHFDKSGADYPVAGYIKFCHKPKQIYRYSVGVVVCD